MAWVTWRQHRFALAGVAVLLGALAVYLWLAGLQLHHAYAAALLHPASSLACAMTCHRQLQRHDQIMSYGYVLQAVPALIGAFVGAPVLARELETGTFRYAWTQGFGRWRWTLAKLVLLAVVVAAAAGAFSVLFSWYYQPFFAAGYHRSLRVVPLAPALFDLRGVAFAAWTLAAFAIGGLAGMLIRRVVPAIAATLAAYAGLALATGDVPAPALHDAAGHQQAERARFRVDHEPVVDQGRQVRVRRSRAAHDLLQRTCPPAHRSARPASVDGDPRAVPRPARLHPVDQLSARPAGSGRSSGSRAAGCSRCRCCSSPRPSGWSAAARPEPAE